ncbi:hypothetical protein [Variovorax paradoxus]|uniref:Uncharacterized protein n=1 Tax=Variovorax paradoxus TaxID=34073 RepID=A0A679JNA3_VARPD|nr:hypothetical protein VVAX_04345 [Variovorax paradoxus]
MLIALIVLSVLNVVLTFVVFCGQRALWARLPEPVVQNFTVGDVATAEQVRKAMHQAKPPTGSA